MHPNFLKRLTIRATTETHATLRVNARELAMLCHVARALADYGHARTREDATATARTRDKVDALSYLLAGIENA